MKSHIHTLIVRVRFDKPTTRTHAVAAFRDNVHGVFYPTAFEDDDPETMTIKSARSAGRKSRKLRVVPPLALRHRLRG
jgi:hypothetical protein